MFHGRMKCINSFRRYHLGEHRLVFGKSHPYSTDLLLPFYIRGPGIPANTTLDHPATHIDTTVTVLDLAGVTPTGPPLDGLSYKAALSATPLPASAWRNFSFSEYKYGAGMTWWAVRQPLSEPRTAVHWWCEGVGEVFDLDADEWQLSNLAATVQGKALLNATLPMAFALGNCSGTQGCSKPSVPQSIPSVPLPCLKGNSVVHDQYDP